MLREAAAAGVIARLAAADFEISILDPNA